MAAENRRIALEVGALDEEADSELGVLDHVREVECVVGVLRGVDVRRAVGHVLVADVRSGKSGVTRACVVAAAVAALVGREREGGVGRDERLDEAGELWVDEVCVDGDDVVGREARHVLVDEGADRDIGTCVVLHDCARAEQAALLSGVKVELERVLRRVLSSSKDAQRFKDDGDAGGVVVGARGTPVSVVAVDGVKVCGDDDNVG